MANGADLPAAGVVPRRDTSADSPGGTAMMPPPPCPQNGLPPRLALRVELAKWSDGLKSEVPIANHLISNRFYHTRDAATIFRVRLAVWRCLGQIIDCVQRLLAATSMLVHTTGWLAAAMTTHDGSAHNACHGDGRRRTPILWPWPPLNDAVTLVCGGAGQECRRRRKSSSAAQMG